MAAGEDPSDTRWRARLWQEPAHLAQILGTRSLFDALFAGCGDEETSVQASPFLVFAVLLSRVAHDLTAAPFVQEWVGPGRRLPVFDVEPLREFAAPSPRRMFLAELLASYTRVASGSTWVRTRGGWRRRRFSELDPLRLLEVLVNVPPAERAAVYRRLGDLALFLTGVFPDFAGGRLLPSLQSERLRRALREGAIDLENRGSAGPGGLDDIYLLGEIGRRSYERAYQAAEGGQAGILAEVAQEFDQARRTLNFLTDSYLYPLRRKFFPFPES
jgi:hypothetical protein